MHPVPLFAVEKLNIDPDTFNQVTGFGLFFMGLMLLIGLGFLAWQYAPILIARSRDKRAERIKASNSIWFDTKESVLHCGHRQTVIELKSLEYYVCADTFETPDEYISDTDIMEKVDRTKSDRAVEQAINRLNAKTKTLFGLDEKLFKRGKDSTAINKMYRSRIVRSE